MTVEDGGVSYETLQDLLRGERRSNKITPVKNGFWAELQAFLREAEEEFRVEQSKDPWSRRAMVLSDRVKNARHAAETVWSLRERKLAMLALAHARDGGRPEGLTKRESGLFDRLLEVLQDGRQAVFEGTAAEPRTPEPKTAPAETARSAQARSGTGPGTAPGAEPEAEATAAPLRETTPADELETDDELPEEAPATAPRRPATVPADTPDADVVTIRALGDIPPFVGPDMQTYILQEGDMASVPQGIADLLVRRGKAAVVNAA